MKKSMMLFVLAFVTLFATESKAQINFGVKGGLNVTRMSFDESLIKEDNRCGFFFGPSVKFTLPVIGLGMDVSALYDQREAKIEGGNENLKQQQIVVPVNARYGFGLGDDASIYFFAGPQFGFNVGSKDQTIVKDIADWTLKTSNFSVNLGFGLMLVKHLQISANYNIACGTTGEMSFSKAADKTWKALAGKTKDGRANAWQIGLAYYF